MSFPGRIVTNIPLQNIWNSQCELNAQRSSYLTKERIKEMLQVGPIDFVVADIGCNLEWIDKSQCYLFWKATVQGHLAEDVNKINVDTFPDNYAFVASEWTGDLKASVILLEKYH